MAHFAKLNESSTIVLSIEVVADSDTQDENGDEDESVGIAFLQNIHGWPNWKKTSFNTRGGVHYQSDNTTPSDDQSKAFRKNFATIGGTYDSTRDAFYIEKPYSSWTLNNTTCFWEAPVAFPSVTKYNSGNTGYNIRWDEPNLRWVATDTEDPITNYRWNVSDSSWVTI